MRANNWLYLCSFAGALALLLTCCKDDCELFADKMIEFRDSRGDPTTTERNALVIDCERSTAAGVITPFQVDCVLDSSTKEDMLTCFPTLVDKKRDGTARTKLSIIANALEIISVENGYPQSLDALSSGDDPLIPERELLIDPWRSPFLYAYPAKLTDGVYDLCSLGPDRQQGTADDLCYE